VGFCYKASQDNFCDIDNKESLTKTDEGFSYFDLAEIQHQLENTVNRKIDVGFIDSFKAHIFQNIEPDLKLIYEK